MKYLKAEDVLDPESFDGIKRVRTPNGLLIGKVSDRRGEAMAKEAAQRFNSWAQENRIVKKIKIARWNRMVPGSKMRAVPPTWLSDYRQKDFLDHMEIFIADDGQRVLVSQPYMYKGMDIVDLAKKAHEWAEARGLNARMVGAACSWYLPDNTMLIEFRLMDREKYLYHGQEQAKLWVS
jgi:hypothetical protein